MNQVASKSNIQIATLCIGFLGLQIGFALQAGNVTRILQNYGADLSQLSFFWLIAPLTGACIQPLIGYFSDKWINSGKTRIPFIVLGGVLSIVALLVFPNAYLFMTLISPLLFGALLILITDAGFNIMMHPLRATVSDYLSLEEQSKGFAVQTFLISIGAIVGSILPYILHQYFNLATTSIINHIPDNVKWSFYIGSLILVICIILNVKAIGRYKPLVAAKALESAEKTTFSILHIPSSMWKIGSIQFFSWSAFFLIWVYMTPAVAQQYYKEYNHGSSSLAYAEAANQTGILFGIYHLSACIVSLFLPFIYKKLNLINSHNIALLAGSIGLIWIFLAQDINNLLFPMLLLGIAWASVLATPFVILSKHIPKNKIGLYFGLFNLFITAPQILNGLLSGYIIKEVFDNNAIYALLIAAASLFIAACLGIYFKNDLTRRSSNF